MAQDDNEQLTAIVEAYIAETKNWPPDDFRIQFDRQDEGIVVFRVIHIEDEESRIPGGGKSLELHVDPETMDIIREMRFQ